MKDFLLLLQKLEMWFTTNVGPKPLIDVHFNGEIDGLTFTFKWLDERSRQVFIQVHLGNIETTTWPPHIIQDYLISEFLKNRPEFKEVSNGLENGD